MIRIAVLASGRGSNLQAILDACRDGRIPGRVSIVISDVEDAPALPRAAAAKVPTRFVKPDDAFNSNLLSTLKEYHVDLVCNAGFMRILAPEVVRAYPTRWMNIHPSLLPAFKGLHAQKRAFEYGVRYAGCTVHFVDENVDTGPIILQQVITVNENDTTDSLEQRILTEEHRLYPEAIRLFAQNRLKLEGRRVHILPPENHEKE
ncbi:MAG: phosphoribosylglycinamide formyltransferase [bacterium]